MRINDFVGLMIVLIVLSCSTQKKLTDGADCFVLGSGGGVTGVYTEYKICDNGTVKQFDFNKKVFEHFIDLDKKSCRRFFNNLDELNLSKYNFSHPGNFNYYIEIYKGSSAKRILWSDQHIEIKPAIATFFNEVDSHLRTSRSN